MTGYVFGKPPVRTCEGGKGVGNGLDGSAQERGLPRGRPPFSATLLSYSSTQA